MDVKLDFDGTQWDIAIDPATGDLALDAPIRAATILSLFCWRRAEDDDVLPGGGTDRMGYWADSFSPVAGDRYGSRYWLLSREKELVEVRRLAEEIERQALEWMLDEGLVANYEIRAQSARREVLQIDYQLNKPRGGSADVQRHEFAWEGI